MHREHEFVFSVDCPVSVVVSLGHLCSFQVPYIRVSFINTLAEFEVCLEFEKFVLECAEN